MKGQDPMFAPGTMTFYSNTNLILLGMVIEQVRLVEKSGGASGDWRAP